MAPKKVFPDTTGVAAEMRRVPQFGRINVNAALLSAPVKYRENVVEVRLGSIVEDSPFQKRRKFDPETFEEDRLLVESIQKLGQRRPACLQAIGQGQYRIVYGHRRIAALRYLNSEAALAIIIQGELSEIATWTAIENMAVPLSPVEKAELAQLLLNQLGMNTADISIRLGVSQRHVQRLLKIAEAAEAVQFALGQEAISVKIAYELALAPKQHQARLVQVATARRLQPDDCARIVKLVTDNKSSPDEAAAACGFLPPDEPASRERSFVADALGAAGGDVITEAPSGNKADSDSPEGEADPPAQKFESLAEGGQQTPHQSRTPMATAKYDAAATTGMLQNEMTIVDKSAVRTIVARGLDRKLNHRDLRVAVLLAGNTTPAKALDHAEALATDATARMLAEITERLGRIRDRVRRRQHNGLTAVMLQMVAKECQALAGETRAAK